MIGGSDGCHFVAIEGIVVKKSFHFGSNFTWCKAVPCDQELFKPADIEVTNKQERGLALYLNQLVIKQKMQLTHMLTGPHLDIFLNRP